MLILRILGVDICPISEEELAWNADASLLKSIR
jgi:hypothetical protein